MSKNAEIAAAAGQSLVSNYRQAPLALDHGKGAEVWDVDGKRYIDMYAGIAVSTLGHAHPRLVQAIADQAGRILHTSNLLYNEPAVRLARRLTAKITLEGKGAILTRAFLCNSGTEAIEACVKLARRAAWLAGETKRTRFVAFHNSFHGRTMGALPLTGTPKYWEGFACDTASVTHLEYGDLDAVRAAVAQRPSEYAAIMVEPVQGEGGVLPAPAGFLPGLRSIADQAGALLIVDEVQTGVGRTGTFFAFQREGIVPDAIALAKGLGGGVPIGAMLIRESLNGVLTPGAHGSTFGGNPLAAAAANAVLDVIEEEGLVARAAKLGDELSAHLRDLASRHPSLFDGERGAGLLRGLLMKPGVDARSMLTAAREQGVLLSVASERVLRFTPPLIVSSALIEEAMRAVEVAASSLVGAAGRARVAARVGGALVGR